MNVSRRTADETRQCILVAAWDLFRQVGFRKTTVADIAGALGMSSANIYRFFASKDALTEAICGNLLDALIEAARTAASGPGDARTRLSALLLTLHSNLRDQMTQEKRVHEVVAIALDEHWPPVHAFIETYEAMIAVVVAEGQASGEFGPGDPKTLAELVSAACAVIHHPAMIAQCAAMKPTMAAEAVIDFALRALANRNPPATS
ncbi:MAG: TetR/AcrR family transcriptional regulator [Roseiarcus sp.]|jgi:AcrR family transcriptional regulator